MQTTHEIFMTNSCVMQEIPDESIQLVVTSPPYPMIELWDKLFLKLNRKIKAKIDAENYTEAFNLMHDELNKTWDECAKKLVPGGICCVNIGDAARSLNGSFQLWQNHSMIIKYFTETLGFTMLPAIIWRKSTNKPNKFMGSGMLPSNAYVTLEHEYILIFRKGAKREFSEEERKRRYSSAFFWEERNNWFSDVWLDLIGTKQEMLTNDADLRTRSAAFPLELAKRLILMFSIYGDTVLDPFWGTGTTSLAAMLTARSSIGYEISKKLVQNFKNDIPNFKEFVQKHNENRLSEHLEFVDINRGRFRYENEIYKFPVMTSQEIFMHVYNIMRISQNSDNKIKVTHIPCEVSD